MRIPMRRSVMRHAKQENLAKGFRFAAMGVSLVFAVCVLAYFPAKIAATSTAIIISGTQKPLVGLKNPDSLNITYKGSPDLVSALRSGTARPVALAGADLDLDGAPDLLIGYDTPSGGVIALLRGNADAFAPKDQHLYKAATQGKIPPTFLSAAAVFAVPDSPDFLATGNFSRSGHRDLLVGTKGGGLYLLAGDGRGNLGLPEPVTLPGQLTALAVTSAGHVAVGTDGADGPQLLVLVPSRSGLVRAATYTLSGPATSAAWGALGGGAGTDLAISTGSSVSVIYSALSSEARRETVDLGFDAAALTVGDFIWDRNGATEMAVLGNDGAVRVLRHGTLDTRPITASDVPARRGMLTGKTPVGRWTLTNQLGFNLTSHSKVAAQSVLQSPRLAASPTHDLMTLDSGESQLSIFDTSGKTPSPQAAVKFSSVPVAAYATPPKLDGGRDLIVLISSQAAPMIIHAGVAAVVNVNTTTDSDAQNACTNNTIMPNNLSGTISLRTAVCAANNYGSTGPVTINVPSGTYQLTSLATGELQLGLVPGSNISVIGTGIAANTIIQQTDGVNRVFNFDPNAVGNVTGALSNITVTGGTAIKPGGGGILAGSSSDAYTFTNVVVTNNATSGINASGGGIDLRAGSLNLTNCTISNNVASVNVGGGIAVTNGLASQGSVSLINSLVTGNTSSGNGLSGAQGAGGEGAGIFMDVAVGSSATISGTNITLNNASGSFGQGGGIFNEAGPIVVIDSRIVGNQAADGSGLYTTGFDATATDNWWGCNDGPGGTGCDTVDGVGGSVAFDPWLVLSISASAINVKPNKSITLEADLTHDSSGLGGFSVPDGTAVNFSGVLGTVSPFQTILTGGIAPSTYTAGSSLGAGSGTTTVDNQSVSVTVDVVQMPAITSPNHITFSVGTASAFTIATTGFPVPSITAVGTLPGGITFVDNGDGTASLSGTPASGTGGNYKITFTAQNGIPPDAQQSFALIVDESPAITSANNAYFSVGVANSFTVATTGFPTTSITQTGSLPSGVTFVDNKNGTGTLSGTPPVVGVFNISFSATNSVGTATQNFTLSVNQNPFITSQNTASLQVGTAGSFTVMGSGVPIPTLTETGALPSGVTFTDQGNGTAILGGLPAAAGTFSVRLLASNSIGSYAQTFTLVVQKGNTTTIVSSSPNPSTLNQSVAFSATVGSSGPVAPTGNVSFMDGKTMLGSAVVNSGQAKLSVSSLTANTHNVTAVYAGDVNYNSSTSSSLSQVVKGAAQFVLSASPNVIAVPTGTPATSTITATGQNGFNSAVSLACTSALPSGVSCQFSSSSITPGTKPATSTLTINSGGPTSALTPPSFKRRGPSSLYAMWLVIPAMLLTTVGMGAPRRRKVVVFCVLLMAGCLFQSACSSGMKAGAANSISGPKGTYNVVVTGTSGTLSNTTTITLTLQ